MDEYGNVLGAIGQPSLPAPEDQGQVDYNQLLRDATAKSEQARMAQQSTVPDKPLQQVFAEQEARNAGAVRAGWETGLIGLGQIGSGIAALGGDLVSKVPGLETVGRNVQQWGAEGYQQAEKDIQPWAENRPTTIEQIKGVGDVLPYLGYQAGSLAPSMLGSVASGVIGAIAGSAAAPVAGTVGGAVAGAASKGFLKSLMSKSVEKYLAGTAGKELTAKVGLDAAAKYAAQRTGGKLGLFASSYLMGLGDIYGNTMDEKGQGSALSALTLAVPYAALDAMTDMAAFETILRGSPGEAAFKRYAKAMLKTGTIEGLGEAGQEIINISAQLANGQAVPMDEALSRIGNSFAASASISGLLGLPGGRVSRASAGQQQAGAQEQAGTPATPVTPLSTSGSTTTAAPEQPVADIPTLAETFQQTKDQMPPDLVSPTVPEVVTPSEEAVPPAPQAAAEAPGTPGAGAPAVGPATPVVAEPLSPVPNQGPVENVPLTEAAVAATEPATGTAIPVAPVETAPGRDVATEWDSAGARSAKRFTLAKAAGLSDSAARAASRQKFANLPEETRNALQLSGQGQGAAAPSESAVPAPTSPEAAAEPAAATSAENTEGTVVQAERTVESQKKLLSPKEKREVKEFEDLAYKEVALQGPENGYKPYKLTRLEKRRLAELRKKYGYIYSEVVDVPKLVKESTPVGTNSAGEMLYENQRGRFRLRQDRADRPQGYPDFGGDLAPVDKQAEVPKAGAEGAQVVNAEQKKDTHGIIIPVQQTGDTNATSRDENKLQEGARSNGTTAGKKEGNISQEESGRLEAASEWLQGIGRNNKEAYRNAEAKLSGEYINSKDTQYSIQKSEDGKRTGVRASANNGTILRQKIAQIRASASQERGRTGQQTRKSGSNELGGASKTPQQVTRSDVVEIVQLLQGMPDGREKTHVSRSVYNVLSKASNQEEILGGIADGFQNRFPTSSNGPVLDQKGSSKSQGKVPTDEGGKGVSEGRQGKEVQEVTPAVQTNAKESTTTDQGTVPGAGANQKGAPEAQAGTETTAAPADGGVAKEITRDESGVRIVARDQYGYETGIARADPKVWNGRSGFTIKWRKVGGDWEGQGGYATSEQAMIERIADARGATANSVTSDSIIDPELKALRGDRDAELFARNAEEANKRAKEEAARQEQQKNIQTIRDSMGNIQKNRKKASVKLSNGKTIEVQGPQYGDYIVHREIVGSEAKGNTFKVTHVPSGMSFIGNLPNQEDAREAAYRASLLPITWNGKGKKPTEFLDGLRGVVQQFRERVPFGQASTTEPTAKGSTVSDLRTQLSNQYGSRRIRVLERSGKVNLVQTAAELPPEAQSMTTDGSAIGGFYVNGKIYLVADNLSSADQGLAEAVFAHEITHGSEQKASGAIQKVLGIQFKPVVAQLDRLVADNDPSVAISESMVPDTTPAGYRDSERVAYFVQEAIRRIQSRDPAVTLSAKAKALYDRIFNTIKAWFATTNIGQRFNFKLTDDFVNALVNRSVGSVATADVATGVGQASLVPGGLAGNINAQRTALMKWYRQMPEGGVPQTPAGQRNAELNRIVRNIHGENRLEDLKYRGLVIWRRWIESAHNLPKTAFSGRLEQEGAITGAKIGADQLLTDITNNLLQAAGVPTGVRAIWTSFDEVPKELRDITTKALGSDPESLAKLEELVQQEQDQKRKQALQRAQLTINKARATMDNNGKRIGTQVIDMALKIQEEARLAGDAKQLEHGKLMEDLGKTILVNAGIKREKVFGEIDQAAFDKKKAKLDADLAAADNKYEKAWIRKEIKKLEKDPPRIIPEGGYGEYQQNDEGRGSYFNSSFEVFNNQDWIKKLPEELLNRTRNYFERQLLKRADWHEKRAEFLAKQLDAKENGKKVFAKDGTFTRKDVVTTITAEEKTLLESQIAYHTKFAQDLRTNTDQKATAMMKQTLEDGTAFDNVFEMIAYGGRQDALRAERSVLLHKELTKESWWDQERKIPDLEKAISVGEILVRAEATKLDRLIAKKRLDKKAEKDYKEKLEDNKKKLQAQKDDLQSVRDNLTLREFLGEYRDPREVLLNTITKQSRLLYSVTFQNQMARLGRGIFLWKPTDDHPAEASEVIGNGPEYGPLAGMLTTRETAQALKDILNREDLTGIWRRAVQAAGLVRENLTVFSPTTQARNFLANIFFAIASGHADPAAFADTFKTFKAYTQNDMGASEEVARAKQLNVVADTVSLGQVQAQTKYLNIQSNLIGKGYSSLSSVIQFAEGLYAYGDDFWKMMAFTVEKKLLHKHLDAELKAKWKDYDKISDTTWRRLSDADNRDPVPLNRDRRNWLTMDHPELGRIFIKQYEAGQASPNSKSWYLENEYGIPVALPRDNLFFTEAEALQNAPKLLRNFDIEKQAAQRIRDTYPTYSMSGKLAHDLARNAILGAFVLFPSEVIRTTKNQFKYLQKEWNHTDQNGNHTMRDVARRRIVGLAIASTWAYALQALTMSLFGVDDDEEEGIRQLAQPWNQNSNLAMLNRDDQGRPVYLDLSWMDPYNYLKRPINALMRQRPVDESMIDSLSEVIRPYTQPDILAGSLGQVWMNKKESGGTIYNEVDNPINQATDIANFLRKQNQPGVFSNFERLIKAASGTNKPNGQPYTLPEEIVALVGFRATTLDPKLALKYRSFEFADAKKAANNILNSTLRSTDKLSDADVMDAFDRAQTARNRAYAKIQTIAAAAVSSGLSERQATAALHAAGISRQDALSIVRGVTPEWKPSMEAVRGSMRTARIFGNPEQAAEIARRFRVVSQGQ